METGKFPISAGWVDELETQETKWYGFSLKTRKRHPGGKALRQEKLSLTQGRARLFVLSLQWIRWGPSTSGRAICLSQATDFNVNPFQKHTHRNIQNNVWANIWAPLAQWSLYIKCTITGGSKPTCSLRDLLPWDLEPSFLWTPGRSFSWFYLSWPLVRHDLAL